jgi:hypothetical protein
VVPLGSFFYQPRDGECESGQMPGVKWTREGKYGNLARKKAALMGTPSYVIDRVSMPRLWGPPRRTSVRPTFWARAGSLYTPDIPGRYTEAPIRSRARIVWSLSL